MSCFPGLDFDRAVSGFCPSLVLCLIMYHTLVFISLQSKHFTESTKLRNTSNSAAKELFAEYKCVHRVGSIQMRVLKSPNGLKYEIQTSTRSNHARTKTSRYVLHCFLQLFEIYTPLKSYETPVNFQNIILRMLPIMHFLHLARLY